jgi:adenosylmethionine---8-amino-7-oxononanoate aminotransferase
MNDSIQFDKDHIWHPYTPLLGADDPILIEAAEGIYLKTTDGRRIIDAISSWWVNIHGHAHPYLAKAIAAQASTLEHVIFAGFTHQPAIQLAKNLLTILPQNQSKIFFSDNGSTAVEVALKMAIQYWDNQRISKRKIIAFDGAYHGDTFGSMSVGSRGLFTNPFSDFLFDVNFIDFPDGNNHNTVFDCFKKLVDQDDVAAFIFEPLVQGAAGMRMYDGNFLDEILEYAQEKEVICIADEVFTGFGRTGKLFACDYLSRKPDIITLSKGLTGGTLPLGVTTCTKKIVQSFETDDVSKTFFHGHSYTANPLACAVANASFELLTKQECQTAIQEISVMHQQYVSKAKNHRCVKAAQSLGTILRIELRTDQPTSYANDLRKQIYRSFISKGLLLRPLGNVIYILPPYIITRAELGIIYNMIDEFMDELAGS